MAFHSHDIDVGVKGPYEGQPANGWCKNRDMVGRSTKRGHGGQAQADQAGCGCQGEARQGRGTTTQQKDVLLSVPGG